MDCDVIRDLLPLYADEACSEKSRALVREHLLECAECRELLRQLQETEIEKSLREEKRSVLQYGLKQFKKRTAAVGSAVSGAVMIPVLICLFLFGSPLGWIDIVLAALCVAMVYSQQQLAVLTEEINAATQTLEESESLQVQLEMMAARKMNSAQVEEYAAKTLGMSKASQGQVTYVAVAQEDKGVVFQNAEGGSFLDQLLATLRGWLS